MDYKELLKVVPTLQAGALASHSFNIARKKRKKASDFVGVAGTTILGSALIAEESKFI